MNEFWQQLQEEMEAQLQVLKLVQECPEELMPEDFLAWELTTREAVDEACLYWTRLKRWPDTLTPPLMWLVSLRLCQALPLAIQMCMTRWPQSPARHEALDWLLIETWPLHVPAMAAKVGVPPLDSDEEIPPPPWLK